MLHRSRTSCCRASGVVLRLVRTGESLDMVLAISSAAGYDFKDTAGSDRGLCDVHWTLLSSQHPSDVSAVADLVIHRHKSDVANALGLAEDLRMHRLLVGWP
jgi:hypothetical protein